MTTPPRILRPAVPGRRVGFSIVELLTVVAILAVLLALLVPSLGRVRELARRTRCRSDIHQVLVALTTCAARNNGVLPSGKRNEVGGVRGEHCIWISDELHDTLADLTGTDELFECVNFRHGFGYHNQYGWVIGYNYLGNHPRMNELGYFESPIRMTADSSLAVWTDLNNWNLGSWTFVAHTEYGAAGVRAGGGPHYRNAHLGGAEPDVLGAEGGNVGYLDGSALWRPIADMKVYETGEWGYGHYLCLW